jgi:hypothetical protein
MSKQHILPETGFVRLHRGQILLVAGGEGRPVPEAGQVGPKHHCLAGGGL